MRGFLLGGAYLTYFIVIPRKRGIPSSQLKPQDPGFRRDDGKEVRNDGTNTNH